MKCFNEFTVMVKKCLLSFASTGLAAAGDFGNCSLQASSQWLVAALEGLELGSLPAVPGHWAGRSAWLLSSGPFPLFFCPGRSETHHHLHQLLELVMMGADSMVTIPKAGTTNWCGHQGELSCKGQTSIREWQGADTGLWKGLGSFPLRQSIIGSASHIFSVKYHSRSDSVNKYSGSSVSWATRSHARVLFLTSQNYLMFLSGLALCPPILSSFFACSSPLSTSLQPGWAQPEEQVFGTHTGALWLR